MAKPNRHSREDSGKVSSRNTLNRSVGKSPRVRKSNRPLRDQRESIANDEVDTLASLKSYSKISKSPFKSRGKPVGIPTSAAEKDNSENVDKCKCKLRKHTCSAHSTKLNSTISSASPKKAIIKETKVLRVRKSNQVTPSAEKSPKKRSQDNDRLEKLAKPTTQNNLLSLIVSNTQSKVSKKVKDSRSRRPSNVAYVFHTESDEEVQRPQSTVAKVCSFCHKTSTPKWRQGPKGQNTLCNSCGVKWKRGQITIPFSPKSPVIKDTIIPAINPVLPERAVVETMPVENEVGEQFQNDVIENQENQIHHIPSPATVVEENELEQCVEDSNMIFNETTPNHDYFESTKEVETFSFDGNNDPVLPKMFAYPRVASATQDSTINYYPFPSRLETPQDRKQYLEQQLSEMSPHKLAQILMLLDENVTRDLKRAATHKQTPELDMRDISDDVWYQICSIIIH